MTRAVSVTESTGEQQQASQREGVGDDDPLERGEVRAEVTTDGGQGNADHRRVDGGDRGSRGRALRIAGRQAPHEMKHAELLFQLQRHSFGVSHAQMRE